MSPTPVNVSSGSLDMSLRELLAHMAGNHVDHVVLVMPDLSLLSVTIATEQKTKEITKSVQRIFGGFRA